MTSLSLVVSNLRNRLAAARKSKDYNDRCFVDVPAQELAMLLDIVERNRKESQP